MFFVVLHPLVDSSGCLLWSYILYFRMRMFNQIKRTCNKLAKHTEPGFYFAISLKQQPQVGMKKCEKNGDIMNNF